VHRTELMRFVHKPQLVQVNYPVETSDITHSAILVSLRHAFEAYDLRTDPYIIELLKQQGQGSDVSKALQKVYVSGKTYCKDQLRSLASKAESMAIELGESPMDWYLCQCITQFEKMVRTSDTQLFDWSQDEKRHLLHILTQLPGTGNMSQANKTMSLDSTSRKIDMLIDLLASEGKDNPNFTCLVFVEQRVWVACIAEILSLHPKTRDLLRVGTFVGTSQSSKRKTSVATFAEPRNQQATLNDFRAGELNVILATSVLEEGIDVSSCHLVICFERPKNLKSFVQRRGRARKQESEYIIFLPESGGGRPAESWQALEEAMRTAYLDDLRQVKLAEENELQDEDGQRYFEIPSTG
jgi:ERCC4-related helicase